MTVRLLYTGSGEGRWVEHAEKKLEDFRIDSGYWYIRHKSATPPEGIFVEDLGVTLLMNSRVTWKNAKSIIERASEITPLALPECSLEDSSEGDRQAVAELIAEVAHWSGFGSSTATKLLHKKRPSLVPILDNMAIFGAYLNPDWSPGHLAPSFTVKDVSRITVALDCIHRDLNRPENQGPWELLAELEPEHTRIELFDTVWWMHFREVEPVRRED